MTGSETYQAFMLDHAAGTLPESLHLAGDIHCLLSCEGDRAAEIWASVRNILLEGMQASPRALGAEQRQVAFSRAKNIIEADYGQVKWRRGFSGAHYAKLANASGQLMHLNAGQSVPSHGHSAREATVILEGALEDHGGVYRRGDIMIAEPGERHRPATYGNTPCTCFVARAPRPFWRFT